jgi:hypothetical protein
VKSLIALAVAVAAIALGAAAANAGADVGTRQVSFVLSSENCGNLPDGTTITGTGTEKAINRISTGKDGLTTISNTTHTQGTAVDEDGNTYVFNYSNEFRITNSESHPDVFSGVMTDSFSLEGRGDAPDLHNGFHSGIAFTFDATGNVTGVAFDPGTSRGDPIDFTTGAAHCDPL